MENHLKAATFLTNLLDNKFQLLGVKFGLDPLFDLFPIIGGIIPTLISFYLIWIAYKIKVPQNKIQQMVGNIFLDFVIGLVPFIGALGDVFYKANSKNLKILKQYYNPVINGEILTESKLTPSIYS